MKNLLARDYNFVEAVGGEAKLRVLITEFYDRIYEDILIGFMFQPFEKEKLIESQMAWLSAKLGDRSGTYTGPNIREAHEKLPILTGMFDRRHQILKELLEESDVPDFVKKEWLALDQLLRANVVRWGKKQREEWGFIDDY